MASGLVMTVDCLLANEACHLIIELQYLLGNQPGSQLGGALQGSKSLGDLRAQGGMRLETGDSL